MSMTIDAPTVNDAHREVSQARDRHEELRRRVAAGDTKVTAANIAQAADAVVLAELRVDAAVTAARAVEAAQREDDIKALRADIAGFDTSVLDGARANYAAAVEALRFLASAVAAHEDARAKLLGRCGALGLTQDEVPYTSLSPSTRDYAALAVQEAAGRLRGAHPLSSDADAAAASEAAVKNAARLGRVRPRRDLAQARADAKSLREQAHGCAKMGQDAAADELLSRATAMDAEVERLAAEVARLDALAA